VKDTLPAYLNPALSPQDLPTGVCFASGGSGFDDLTANMQVLKEYYQNARIFC
jgi:hypothetical protein